MCLLRAKVKNAFFRIAITHAMFTALMLHMLTLALPINQPLGSYFLEQIVKKVCLWTTYIVIDFIIHVQGGNKKKMQMFCRKQKRQYTCSKQTVYIKILQRIIGIFQMTILLALGWAYTLLNFGLWVLGIVFWLEYFDWLDLSHDKKGYVYVSGIFDITFHINNNSWSFLA